MDCLPGQKKWKWRSDCKCYADAKLHSEYRRVLENLRKTGKTLFTLKESDSRSVYPLNLDGERRFKSDMCTKTASKGKFNTFKRKNDKKGAAHFNREDEKKLIYDDKWENQVYGEDKTLR